MASTISDFKLASTAAGFTLGFGFLCVWNAIQQTRAVRSPLRSVYIFMVWGEIFANLCIGIIGWLFLDGYFRPRWASPHYLFLFPESDCSSNDSVPILFTILF